MELRFASNQLRRNYLDLSEATLDWSLPVARKYIRVLTVLASAKDLRDVATVRNLRLHPLRGSRAGEWAVDLHGRWRLCFVLDGNGIRVTEVTNHYGD